MPEIAAGREFDALSNLRMLANQLAVDHPKWCKTEPGGCSCGLTQLRAAAEAKRPASNLAWFREHFPDVEITPEQEACCRYLERSGKRFMVDFGYENAPGIVWEQFDSEIYERDEREASA